MNSFVLPSTFRNFAIKEVENYSVSAKKELNSFDLLSTFRNFAIKEGEIYSVSAKKE